MKDTHFEHSIYNTLPNFLSQLSIMKGENMLENNIMALQTPKYPRGGVKTTGRLCVSSNPSGALVYIDGIVATKPNGEGARTSTCIEVQEGRRDVVIRLEGYDDIIRYADIWPGKTTNINANFKTGKPGKITPFGLAGLYYLAKMFL